MKEDKDSVLDKRAPEKYRGYKPQLVQVCKHCLGTAPCWCLNHVYEEQWKFVWNAVKTCKGS